MLHSQICPHCKSLCWINEGDINDLSGNDTEVAICWNCKQRWLLEGCEEWTTLEDGYDRNTFQTPNEAAGLENESNDT